MALRATIPDVGAVDDGNSNDDGADILAQGERIIALFRNVEAQELTPDQRLERALSAIGAWRDLDGDALLDAIERGRRERRPTPPIDAL